MDNMSYFPLILAVFITCVQNVAVCERADLNSPNGTITHWFPEGYSNNLNLEWRLELPTLVNFTLEITKLWLEESSSCKADSLLIRHGESSKRNLGPFCGRKTDNFTHTFLDYGFSVFFLSDKSVTQYGFSISYMGVQPDSQQICDMMLDTEKREIGTKVLGRKNKYPKGLNCSWDIYSSGSGFVRIDVKRFDIEFSGQNCIYDHLEIWELPSEEMGSAQKRLGRFCGNRYRWTVLVYSHRAKIVFVTDQTDNYFGFLLNYSEHMEYLDGEVQLETMWVTPSPVSKTFPPEGIVLDESISVTWHIRTNPGFYIQVDFNEKIDDRTFVAFNGPDRTFPRLNDIYGENRINSNGFHLLFQRAISNATVAVYWELSFRAMSAFALDSTTVTYVGTLEMRFPKKQPYPCCIYQKVIAPTFSHLAELEFTYVAHAPNVDECAYFGIAFFDGEVDFDNIIGPFCDVIPSSMTNLVKNLIVSSSVVYVVQYDYISTRSNRWYVHWIHFKTTKCRGYHPKPVKGKDVFIEDAEFSLDSKLRNNSKIVTLRYVERADECVIVNFLPHTVDDTNRFIIKSDPSWDNFQYRVCRQFGSVNDNASLGGNPVAKFELEQSCGNFVNISNSEDGIIFDDDLDDKNAGWTTEFIRLEIGNVEDNMCKTIGTCVDRYGTVYLNYACGQIRISYPTCHWVLTLPRDQNFAEMHWILTMKMIAVYTAPPYGYLEIQEHIVPSYRLKSRSSMLKQGLPRVSWYITVEAFDVTIHPVRMESLDLLFQLGEKEAHLKHRIGETDECHKFNDHCYTFEPASTFTSWDDAMSLCRARGGHVVSINTLAELQFIKDSLATVWKDVFFGRNYGLIFIGLSDVQKAGVYRWTDGSPLTVSDWYYPFDGFNNIPPTEPKLPLDVELIQPVYDRRLRCTAMNIGNPFYSTNWMKIDCEKKYDSPTNTICEEGKVLRPGTWNGSIVINQKTQDIFECPDEWNFVRNICLAVLTAPVSLKDSIQAEEAVDMCEIHGGTLSVVNKFSVAELKIYLTSLGMLAGDGDIWVKLDYTRIDCISLSLLDDTRQYNDHIAKNTTGVCIPTDGRVSHAMCERNVHLKEFNCPSYLFTCKDGTCLNPATVCNGQMDCQAGEDEINCAGLHGTYGCGDGQTVSISKFCDFHRDCQDGSDEKMCIHPDCPEPQYRCLSGQCVSKEQRCDHKLDCVDGSDEEACDWGLNCVGFACPAVGCLPQSQFQDLQPDCPDASEADEDRHSVNHARYYYFVEEDDEMDQRENFDSMCPGHVDHQRCHSEHITCFPRHKACVYDHDQYGQLKYCRNGAHLKHCENFECPAMFKCPESYCVPFYKVCDGTIDCVDGTDEAECSQQVCPGKFRCGNTSQCISFSDLCDGRVNCQSNWMDEIFCDLRTFDCPDNCTCRGYVISCNDVNLHHVPAIEISSNVRVLDLGRNELNLNSSSVKHFWYSAVLILSDNKLTNIPLDTFTSLSNLLYLDLSSNMLRELRPRTFEGLVNLLTLKLQGNPLSLIERGTFSGLSSLPNLNLSGLMISELGDHVFHGLEQLKELDLSNNEMRDIKLEAFALVPRLDLLLLEHNPLDNTVAETFYSLNVETMRTDSYRFCCYVGENVKSCLPEADVFSSCSDLLANDFVQIVVWMFGVLAALGNVSVIIWRIVSGLSNAPSVFALHLSISDTLMAIYLICLASVDTSYRGTYILHDKDWRESLLCHFIGALATISCEMSLFTLLCIAVDRTKRLVYPFAANQFTVKKAWLITLFGWVCSLAIALVPFVIPSYFGNYYGRNAICLPFNFAEATGNGWEFATVVFVGLNTTALLLIIVLYVKIYYNVKESQAKAGREDRSDLEVARRLSLVIMTNVVCFIPIIIVNISAVLGQPVNRDIASVLTTVVLPVNSAINPYLFTFSACRAKKPNHKATTQGSKTKSGKI